MENTKTAVDTCDHKNKGDEREMKSDEIELPVRTSIDTRQTEAETAQDEAKKAKEEKLFAINAEKQKIAFLALRRTQIHLQPRSSNYRPARFVSIDVEAYEFNHRWVTEVGISTLFTDALCDQQPGPGAVNWVPFIEARHFRIIEYRSRVNSKHVHGCPDKFDFGTSEWIYERDIATVIDKFLSAPPPYPSPQQPNPCVILVGHNVISDVKFLQQLGIDMKSKVDECIDTDDLFKATNREARSISLGKLLARYKIPADHLHNAGNDAFYTLQVLLAMAADDLANPITEEQWEEHKKERIRIACEEITQRLTREFDSWKDAADKASFLVSSYQFKQQILSIPGKGASPTADKGKPNSNLNKFPSSSNAASSVQQGTPGVSHDRQGSSPSLHQPKQHHRADRSRGSTQRNQSHRGRANTRGDRGSRSSSSVGERGGYGDYYRPRSSYVPLRPRRTQHEEGYER